jgi:FkbH-like protein
VSSAKTRCLILSDFNIQPLADFLNRDDNEPACEAVVGPFGQVAPPLLQISEGKTSPDCDCLIVWARPEAVIGAYDTLLKRGAVSAESLSAEVEAFATALISAARRVKHLFFMSWTQPHFRRDFGVWNMPADGATLSLMRMNVALSDRLAPQTNIFVLNAGSWISAAGAKAWNRKLWFLAKVPFSPEVFEAAAGTLKSALHSLQGRSRKLLILDLDETLWGGIVGEVGWEGIRLGGHDAIGEAYGDFQQAVKALSHTGVVLAIASKNDESVALEAIDKHPEMILRRVDFAAWRINWSDKAQNIVEIANELNLDLSSVVYVDDSAAERSRIRSALPAVSVPEWPQDVFLYTESLAKLSCFDKASITSEDLQRGRMYVIDRERSETRNAFQSMADWLESLQMKVCVETLSRSNAARAAQLFNKTNQMNLSTRRMSEAELLDWSTRPGNDLLVFRVSDKFGDYGLTGMIGLQVNRTHALITDYLLSCRVMGRGVEELMLAAAIDSARSREMAEIHAQYLQTSKNAPCLAFFKNSSRFRCDGSHLFTWRTSDDYPFPHHILVKR